MGLEWKKVRAAMWSGRDNGAMYTVKQRGDATFYVTRGIERSHLDQRARSRWQKTWRNMTQAGTPGSAGSRVRGAGILCEPLA